MKLLILFVLLLTGPVSGYAQNFGTDYHTARETYNKTNEIHQFLSQYSGEWTGEMTVWLYPNSNADKFNITAQNKLILNGRFLQSSIAGQMIGTPFESLLTLGYSTTNQRFTTTILDNIGTGTVTLTGYWATPLKTIELFGDMPTPENTDVVHIKQVITFIDKDTYLVQNFDKRAGQEEFKNLEYRFTRKK